MLNLSFLPSIKEKETMQASCDEALDILKKREAENPFKHQVSYLVHNGPNGYLQNLPEPLQLGIAKIESFMKHGDVHTE